LSNLRIGFNLCPFSGTEAGGVAHYATSIFREFANLIPHRLTVFHYQEDAEWLRRGVDWGRLKTVALENDLEMLRHRAAIDVLFTPYYWPGVAIPDMPTVNFIPDIQEQYYPSFFSEAGLRHRGIYHSHSAKASTILIVSSHYTKKTIIEKFHVPEEKIEVIYLGQHPIFLNEFDLGERPSSFPTGVEDYLFYPSNPWLHKNHVALLEALLSLKTERGLKVPCLLTGHLMENTQGYVDLRREIETRGLGDQAFHLGRVGLKELKYLYLNAAALVHPSLFEGFGIPVLEAMTCGCPIIASNRTSIPEVAGESGLYFNPNDIQDIRDKIVQLFAEREETCRRVDIGRELAKNFSDQKMAEETLTTLDRAYFEASGSSLRRRALEESMRSRMPSITCVVIPSQPIPSALKNWERLVATCTGRLQVILAAPPGKGEEIAEATVHGIESFPSGEELAQVLKAMMGHVRGEFVMFSDCNVQPLESFVNYITAHKGSATIAGDFLYGESVYTDPAGLMWSAMMPGLSETEKRALCCEDFAFAVRSRALEVALDSKMNFTSPGGLAFHLWDRLPRQELFRPVTVIQKANFSQADFYANKFTTLFSRYFARKWAVTKIMDTDLFRRLARILATLYVLLPSRARKGLLAGVKTMLQKMLGRSK
jgi:glycosyltransferase involved in cell wall biosynthesis